MKRVTCTSVVQVTRGVAPFYDINFVTITRVSVEQHTQMKQKAT